MKVLFDMTHIRRDKIYSSISIYIFRILDVLSAEERQYVILLIPTTLESYIKQKYSDFRYILFPYTNDVLRGNKFFRILKQIKKYRKIVNESKCDILFIANDLCPYTFFKLKPKKIVVIHDLKAIKDSTLIRNVLLRYIYFCSYGLFIKNADSVIAISNYTKTDILKYYKRLNTKKITVVYNGVRLAEKAVAPNNFPIKTNFLLFVNTLQQYKNVSTLLKAYNLMKEKIQHKLVVVGKSTSYWEYQIMPFVEENGLSNRIIHLEYVTEQELRYLYENASLFVSPSLREGFGYTPIEAAMCRCPVICSTCEALPDTTLNKLVYYAPADDEVALSKQIFKVLNNPPSFLQLKNIADTYINNYSCNTQKEKIFSIFKSEMSKKEQFFEDII